MKDKHHFNNFFYTSSKNFFHAKPQYNAVKITMDATVFENEGALGVLLPVIMMGIFFEHEPNSTQYTEVMNPTLVESKSFELDKGYEMAFNYHCIQGRLKTF